MVDDDVEATSRACQFLLLLLTLSLTLTFHAHLDRLPNHVLALLQAERDALLSQCLEIRVCRGDLMTEEEDDVPPMTEGGGL